MSGVQTEDELQAQIINFCQAKKIVAFAVINDSYFSGAIRRLLIVIFGKSEGMKKAGRVISQIVARNKRIGLTPGVPDLILVLDGKTIYIELKVKKGKLSFDQEVFTGRLIKLNQRVYIARSLNDFIEIYELETNTKI